MSHASLADFLERLAAAGQLTRITAEVDPRLELADITRRVAAAGGPALLFDRVRGQSLAVVTNLLGTPERACLALGIDSLDEAAARVELNIEAHTPRNWFDRLKTGTEEAGANKFRPKLVKHGPCGQVARLGRDVDLAGLPLVQSWPGESGPALTAGLLITALPDGSQRGLTLCPLQAIGQNTLAVIDDGNSDFARHWAAHQAAGEKLPVAVCVGGDPRGVIAASIERPEGGDALHLWGLLAGSPVEVVRCRTHAVEVPAESDLVVEGYLDPAADPVEVQAAAVGGNHYRPAQPAPVLHVTAVTHRSHPIVPAIIDSGPEGELGVLFRLRERMLLPAVRAVAAAVVDLHLPVLGGLHRYAFVAIDKAYPHQARQIASALWGMPALQFVKFLVLVNRGVDVHDPRQVWAQVGANAAFDRDLWFYDGPVHQGDHAAVAGGLARHLALDATSKLPCERPGGWPGAIQPDEQVRQLVTARWAEFGLPGLG